MAVTTLLVVASVTLVLGQRPFFAGTKPIGYPIVTTTEGLGDRFGEVDGTTSRLPIEANGDRDLVDRLSKLPIDKQPFWFINWQAYEEHRQKPQTWPQKPNEFVDPVSSNFDDDFYSNPDSLNSGNVNPNSDSSNLNPGSINSNVGGFNSNAGNVNSNFGGVSSNPGNVNSNVGGVNSNPGNVNSNVGGFNSSPGNVNSNFGGLNSNPDSVNSNVGGFNSIPGNVNSNVGGLNSNPGNLNSVGGFNSNPGNVNSNVGGFDSNPGNVNSNIGGLNSNPGNVNSNSGSFISNDNLGNANVASGAATGFVSSDRFGVDESPKQPDNKIETAYTSPKPAATTADYSNSAGVLLSLGDRKKPQRGTKTKK